MRRARLASQAADYLEHLCLLIPPRPVGSPGNQEATTFFANLAQSFGFEIQTAPFSCQHWIEGGVRLIAGDLEFEARVSPYSLGGTFQAPLIDLRTLEELEQCAGRGKILLLRGQLAAEQLLPRSFPFFKLESHQRVYQLLDQQQPAAIIAATGRNPELAGALYPFPLIEDGGFDIPSIYLRDVDGEALAAFAGQEVSLLIAAQRIPSSATNVIARCGARPPQIVVCAHIDAKISTPGALDNASGVSVLLLLADLLRSYRGSLGVELLALNGEDYYSAPGQVQYLEMFAHDLRQLQLVINLDLLGWHDAGTAFSLYSLPASLAATVRQTLTRPGMREGEPWFQGDHAIFVQQDVAAVAIASENLHQLSAEITHTALDLPEQIDTGKLADIALAIHDLIETLAAKG